MPRNKYPEQTVEKILDAAALLFLQKGYQNTTLQDIIDATKLSKGAVYHHFRSSCARFPRRRSRSASVTVWATRCGSRCAISGTTQL